MEKTPTPALSQWFRERLPLEEISSYFSKKSVPRHKHSFWYYFGGLTLFFFAVQVVTGILLSLYYAPSPDRAYESVRTIVNEVSYGWLVRSIHAWSANLMIGMLFVHMFSVFLLRSYRRPRELMWLSGVVLLFLTLGFGFTGYLLPWDTMAYFATLIGTEVPKTLPIIGTWGVSLIRGSEEIGHETLTRMYSLHVIILPIVTLMILTFHIALNQVYGSSIPIGITETRPPLRFFPNFFYRDIISWIVGLICLVALAVISPWGLGEKADPLASAPAGIKPEWYFLPLYQTLKIVPATVLSINGELVVNSLVVVSTVLWIAVPFMDRRALHGAKNKVMKLIGILVIAYLVLMIVLAYLGW